jgi:hypothetical protein
MLQNVLRRRPVRRAVLSISLVALVAVVPSVGQGTEEAEKTDDGRVKGYVPPPTDLKLVGDHWTPYDPPTPPDGVDVHVVVKGDTLWDLAGRYYDDNYLWPVIWDANRYITYSHWIYPGDPLVIPPKPGVVGEAGLEPPPLPVAPAAPGPEPKPEKKVEKPAPTGPVLYPVAAASEIACAPRLVERFDPTPLTISGRDEPEKELQATGDVVYINSGRDMGIEPGAEYSVIRAVTDIEHPESGGVVGKYVASLGKLRVIAVHDTSSTAEIVEACDAMMLGDHLVPFRETPVPMLERVQLRQLATPYPGEMNGWVVTTGDPEETIAGAGDLVGIDLSSNSGLTVGDRVLFWRGAEGTETRKVMAHGVVLGATGAGATVKILESREEVVIGDRVEAL